MRSWREGLWIEGVRESGEGLRGSGDGWGWVWGLNYRVLECNHSIHT